LLTNVLSSLIVSLLLLNSPTLSIIVCCGVCDQMKTLLSDLHRRTATAATTLKHDNASKIVEAVIVAKARAGDALQRGMGNLQDASDNGSLPLDAVLDGRVAALVADAWVAMQVRVFFYIVPKHSYSITNW